MARIENENANKTPDQLGEMQDEIQQLKKQLKRKQSKKFFNCASCSVILILVFVGLGAVVSAVMAKSGLWQLPFFSDYFYHAPEAVYRVNDVQFTENDLLNRLQKLAAAEALKQGKIGNISINFELSEGELTALLRGQAAKNQELAQKIEFWQIAVSTDSAQFFLKAKSPKNLILTLDFMPSIADGKLNLDVKNFKIGDLSLPKFCGAILAENAGANIFNPLLNSFSAAGRIESINLIDHKMKIKILISKLNF
jgi:hypothetical protein